MGTSIIILDSQSKQGGASRRTGGRDERPPTVSPLSAADSGAPRRWIPPSVKRDASNPEKRTNGTNGTNKYRPGFKDDLGPEEKQHATFRKVRGILNKLTPEKFDKLSLELLNVGIESQVILKGIILLIFEKALDEPKYSTLYAQLCHRLCEDAPNFEPPSSNITTFRRLLLNKCQDEFENRSHATEEFDKDGPLTPEEAEQLILAKHKMLGNIKFIGELGKMEMLHEGILHKCIKQLLEKKKNASASDVAEDLECLCQIMRTVGRRLDTDRARTWMDQYFRRMDMFQCNPELPSRIRFLLQDIKELRNNGWVPRTNHVEKTPRTIQQVREEAAKDFGLVQPNMARGGPLPGSMAMFERQINGRGLLAGGGRGGGLSDIFGSGQHGFHDFPSVGSGDIGTGPGVIHMDTFSPGYSTNMGRNRNNPGFQRGEYTDRRNRQDGSGTSPKMHRDRDQQQQRGGNQEQRGHYRDRENNQQRDNTNNRDNQRDRDSPRDNQRDKNNRDRANNKDAQNIRELPPRFRKQQQGSQHTEKTQLQTGNSNRPRSGSPQQYNNTSPRESMGGRGTVPPGEDNAQHSFIKSAASGEEISLRPSNKNFPTMFKPNTPSMLPKSAQSNPVQQNTRPLNMEPKPAPLIQKPPQITIKQVDNKESKTKVIKKNISKDDLMAQCESLLKAYHEGGNVQEAVNTMKGFSISNKLRAEMVLFLMRQTLDKSDDSRESVSRLITAFKDDKIITADNFMEALSSLLEKMKELEVEIPLVRSYVAKYAAQAVVGEMVSLAEVSEPFDNGAHYPLFMLILQQLHKAKDKEWLTKTFTDSKIDLANMLPECDRVKGKERLMEILEDRGLSFMFPLLRVQSDLWKQIQANPNPQHVYKWIKDNVDTQLHTDPGFINILMTNVLRFIGSESTLGEGVDRAQLPDKVLQEKEKELMTKFNGVLQAFLHDSVKLQLIALYSLQVFSYNNGFPKGMLLRMFMLLYDLEVVDEDTFLRWKEEVNDQYPGKGKALFQVNTWLTWLEQAEEESEEEEDD